MGGLVLHSFLLVPYYSWQYSHAKHHAKTNHLMDGETHNPNTQAEIEEAGYVALFHAIGEEGFAGFQLFAHLVVGWPAYLITNATGARRLYNHKAIEDNTLDHFRPGSNLFPPNWERRIYVGTTCWLACCWYPIQYLQVRLHRSSLFLLGPLHVGQLLVGTVHLAPAHVTGGAALWGRRVDVGPRRAVHHRPPLRRALRLLRLDAPPHRLDARLPPPLQ